MTRIAALVMAGAIGGHAAGDLRPAEAADPYETVGRIHWLGLAGMAEDTNAAYFLNLWNMPEAAKVRNAALQKLAEAPWRTLTNSPPPGNDDTNHPGLSHSERLRPLLDDVLQHEGMFWARQATNSALTWAYAIRLDPERAAVWKTNQSVLTDFVKYCGFAKSGNSNEVTLSAAGDWTVLTLAPGGSRIGSELAASARTNSTRVDGTNFWVQAEFDLGRFVRLSGLRVSVPPGFPQARARVCGEGDFVRTRAELNFPRPLELVFEPWRIPTNYVREPLISFSALQGIGPWLSRLPLVKNLEIAPVPNQFFSWALNLGQVNTFVAAPLTNVTEQIDRLGLRIERDANAWLTNHALGWAEYSAPNHGINWMPVPLFAPTIQSLGSVVGPILLARVCPTLPPLGENAPPELFDRVTSRTNLVYYDWEITEARVRHWVFMGQSARLAFNRAQLAPSAPSLEFLSAVAPKLGNTITEVVESGPAGLSLVRKSHCGLTGLELHLLMDWLESPHFPRSTYTLSAPPAQVLRWRAKTRTFELSTNQVPVPK